MGEINVWKEAGGLDNAGMTAAGITFSAIVQDALDRGHSLYFPYRPERYTVQDITLSGSTGYTIRADRGASIRSNDASKYIFTLTGNVSNMTLEGGRWGSSPSLGLLSVPDGYSLIQSQFRDIELQGGVNGIVAATVTLCHFDRVRMTSLTGQAWDLGLAGNYVNANKWTACSITNCAGGWRLYQASGSAGQHISNRLESCWFQSQLLATAGYPIYVKGYAYGLQIVGCYFEQAAQDYDIYLEDDGEATPKVNQPVYLGDNTFLDPHTTQYARVMAKGRTQIWTERNKVLLQDDPTGLDHQVFCHIDNVAGVAGGGRDYRCYMLDDEIDFGGSPSNDPVNTEAALWRRSGAGSPNGTVRITRASRACQGFPMAAPTLGPGHIHADRILE